MLADYDFSLHHLLGSHNSAAEALSQLPVHDDGSNDNAEVVILKPTYFQTHATPEIDSLEACIHSAQDIHDPVITKNRLHKLAEWRIDDYGTIWVKNNLYILKNAVLQGEILQNHHDSPLAGHPRCHSTQNLIERTFFWPGLSQDVHQYVNSCMACQENRTSQLPTSTALHSHTSPSQPWEVVSVDLIGPLSASNGCDMILNIVNHFSKIVVAIPTSITLTSPQLTNLYKTKVFPFFGVPKKIMSDRRPQFVSKFMHDICQLLSIEQNLLTAYHPKTNTQVERMNHEVAQYLHMYISYHQDDWTDWLPLAQFALNNWVSTSTGESAFYLNHRRHPHC